MKTENLKAVIFDLGGVILNLDVNQTLLSFKKLFGEKFDIMEEAHLNVSFFVDYERGHISCEQFRDYVRETTRTNTSDEAIDEAWNAMLKDIPAERIQWLEELKSDYKIYLLSNTNVIHLEAFHKLFGEQTPYAHPDKLFDKLYYSCSMGMRKPDEEIYREVLRDLGIEPHEALFFDDKQENLEPARQLGMNVQYVERNSLERAMLPKASSRA